MHSSDEENVDMESIQHEIQPPPFPGKKVRSVQTGSTIVQQANAEENYAADEAGLFAEAVVLFT